MNIEDKNISEELRSLTEQAIQNGFKVTKVTKNTSSIVKNKKQNKNIDDSKIKITGFKKYTKHNKKRNIKWVSSWNIDKNG